MGYIAHDVAVVVIPDYREAGIAVLDGFVAGLPDDVRQYVLGPVVGINGYTTYVVAPDGSKEGWEPSNIVQMYREEFVALGRKLGADVIYVRFGGDFAYDHGTQILDTTDVVEPVA